MLRITYYHRWYIVAGVVLLFILTQAGLWGFYFHQVQLWEESMGEELRNIAVLAVNQLNDLPESLWVDSAYLNKDIFQNLLEPFSNSGLIEDCFLLTSEGAWVVGLINDVSPGDFDPVLALDEVAIGTAAAGITTRTEPYLIADLYFQNAYTPVLDNEGNIRAVLGVRARVSSFDWFFRGRIIMVVISLAGVLVFLILGMAYWRLSGNMLRLESAMAESERLAAMGRMSASVAHEIRNPLGIIEQTISLLRRRYDREGQDEVFDYIPEEVDRLNKLIEEFLEFAKGGKPDKEPVDIVELINGTVKNMFPEFENLGIEIDCNMPESFTIQADKAQMVSVILNLLYNSRDAMPDGGKISINLVEDSDQMVCTVSDNGVGMDGNTVDAATEPFYTTKEKGAGLGLSIVKMIIENHGGIMIITSELEKGTEVELRVTSH